MSSQQALFSLHGKVALVTGASRGLGRALAIGLAQAGAEVICSSSRPGGSADTEAAITAMGGKAYGLAADLSDPDQVASLAAQAYQLTGRIDVLINNGGTISRFPAAKYPLTEWQKVVDVNLNAAFQLSQLIGQKMLAAGQGKIINIASMLSFQGGITVPAYTASKHAIVGLTKALANEWAASNVQVNAIAPGYFRTDNTQALQDNPERNRDIEKRIPAGQWGEPEQLVGAAVFLATAASDYVNGHVLAVDGGWLAR
ncbi:2-dehydro-3-deoxy-D-gluconate 5-dehydrogenase KduD [Thalassotalea euphylliae]|uniref:2-dehydro-3-deoxy-D-gluconate 5-dehydrogenase KduD n=1 Tax=Thalassotalea euphylliae TaxID=1655234 RepID=A0A3E0UBY1_9GAMM|nr:2-dehydro-3-deoxy-D-gluconate 5-dehydrogenase KduD [Thalassotalea euphylliae]REL34350.1 2-dehydro-3-deoxy-D-gluconate 5-dehydrogenase KduD [Thalassotalea euphylliae]